MGAVEWWGGVGASGDSRPVHTAGCVEASTLLPIHIELHCGSVASLCLRCSLQKLRKVQLFKLRRKRQPIKSYASTSSSQSNRVLVCPGREIRDWLLVEFQTRPLASFNARCRVVAALLGRRDPAASTEASPQLQSLRALFGKDTRTALMRCLNSVLLVLSFI